MNSTSGPAASSTRLPRLDRAWEADWDDFVILNFSLPPAVLAPHVPYELELRDGRAWVSLVWFHLRRMRFAGTGAVGRWLCRPISEHPFLNVRTYVRPAAGGGGICFLAEWIPNPISLRLGPLLYGLPYRYGRFTEHRNPGNGTMSLRIDDPRYAEPFCLTTPLMRNEGHACPPDSIDAFLLERYQAYTFEGSRACRFRVAHRPWCPDRADWIRYELGFLAKVFPWFARAEFGCAHLCGSLADVAMGRPHAAKAGWKTIPVVDATPEPVVLHHAA